MDVGSQLYEKLKQAQQANDCKRRCSTDDIYEKAGFQSENKEKNKKLIEKENIENFDRIENHHRQIYFKLDF